MSHYSVAVFQKEDGLTLDELLEPFDEEKEVPQVITKAEIIANVREEIEQYRKEYYEEYIADPEKYVKEHIRGKNDPNEGHIRYLRDEFPKRLKWTDEECYRYGTRYYDNDSVQTDGSVIDTYNPDAKWDWYSVGGRFSNIVPLLDGGFADEASMDDVDIDYHDKKAYKSALRFWQMYIEGEKPRSEKEKEQLKFVLYKPEYYTERYESAEDYADDQAGFTFYAALLPDGEWLEPGEMGWFGVSAATADDDKAWRKRIKEILQRARDEHWYITIVDCHI